MADTNRTGRVSAIDYKAGTYEVTYFDRGKSVTRQINAISNGEYKMPNIGQIVSVSHSSNGAAAATTTGTVWNRTNRPAEGYKGLYRKEYGSQKGQAYSRYDENTGVYTQYIDRRTGRVCNGEIYDEAGGAINVSAGGKYSLTVKTGMGIEVEGGEAKVTLNGAVIKVTETGDVEVTSPAKVTVVAPEVSITATSGDVIIQGVSLVNHTHKDAGGGQPIK